MHYMLDFLLNRLASFVVNAGQRLKQRHVMQNATRFPGIHASVSLGPNVVILAHPESVTIGPGTYINDGILSASNKWPLHIGERCAIGYRVSIKTLTHDPKNPTADDAGVITPIGAPITIGNRCWIGDNVFVCEGITLGDDVIVGANSVVTKSFPNGAVVAGAPAKKIR
jgi:maltose O-acetyltransferase